MSEAQVKKVSASEGAPEAAPLTSLKELKAAGAVVSTKPVPKTIKWTLGETEFSAIVHVRRLSIGEYERLQFEKGDPRSRSAVIISAAISLGKDGSETIDYEDAYQFEPALAEAMFGAFNEVNAEKKPDAGR